MAHLDDDRGQLILITGVALAVIFIALAVIANSAIYTENLASRGDTTGSTEALEVRNEVTENIGGVIIEVNRFNTSSLASSLTDGIEDTDESMSKQASTENGLIGVEHVGGSTTDGTRIYDNTSGGSTFVEESTGSPDWTVVSGTEVRRFQMSLQPGTITSADELDDSADANPWSDEFIINVTDGGEIWQIHIGQNSAGDDTLRVIRGDRDSGTAPTTPPVTVGSCSLEPGSGARHVDLSRAVVGGRYCEPLEQIWNGHPESVGSSYDITFENGDDVEGEYTLTAKDDSILPEDNVGTDEPSYSSAVYDTTVKYRYDTPKTVYLTEIRVAPGEPRD